MGCKPQHSSKEIEAIKLYVNFEKFSLHIKKSHEKECVFQLLLLMFKVIKRGNNFSLHFNLDFGIFSQCYNVEEIVTHQNKRRLIVLGPTSNYVGQDLKSSSQQFFCFLFIFWVGLVFGDFVVVLFQNVKALYISQS